MTLSTLFTALGLTLALTFPLASLADAGQSLGRVTSSAAPGSLKLGDLSPDGQYIWQGEESGWQLRPIEYRFDNGRLLLVNAPSGHMQSLAAESTPLKLGDISLDREYVFMGEEGGWQIRPMQYVFERGRLVHVDDPPGHMTRQADTRPLTEAERRALESSGGG
ncbi:MAG: hypothetical protein IPP91_19605 [Betaproteobacteria bacterium]|nr:hypothetical protein [Betaproteobacteria bacterium]